MVLLLDDAELKASTSAPLVEADHGRIETRTATVSTEIDWLEKQHQWPGLKAIGKVVRVRETAVSSSTETAYYLLSARWRRRQGFVRPVVLQDAISVVDNARF